jgi:phytoene dehydrogenase-like protein
MQKPVIVVGGGPAGLACASYLARGGRAVTLLEKGPSLGGRSATDYVHGYALNRGAHALYTGGPASEVLRDLGVTYEYGVAKQVYVMDSRGAHRLPATVIGFLTTTLLDGADKRELAGFFMRLSGMSPETYARTSVSEWIAASLRRPRTRHLITGIARVAVYSSALDVISADVAIGRLKQAARHPVHYVAGGWQTLVDGLRETAIGAGVEVRTSAGVELIDVTDGAATGVRVRGGQPLPASDVVLAVPPEDALRLLGDRSAGHLARHVAGMAPGHVGALDVALSALPSATHTVVFDLERPRFLTAQSTVVRLAPFGGAVIHAFSQPDYRALPDAADERAALEGIMDQFQPGWREVVVEQRFLPRMLGTSALPLASQGGLAGRAAHRSQDVRNVYFAGDWVGPRGYLLDAAFESARASARLVLGSAERQPLLRQAA